MSATVFLHIGTPKTGTTALQYFMDRNWRVLASYGVDVPAADEFLRIISFGKNRNAIFVGNGHGTDKWQQYMTTLIRHAGTAGTRAVFLSDEGLYEQILRKPAILQDLKKAMDEAHIPLRVIIYLRRQDEYLYSYWAQQIKEWRTETLVEWLQDESFLSTLDYSAALDTIAGIVGKDALIVRIFDRERFSGGSIYSDILSILGLTLTSEYEREEHPRNETLDATSLGLKRMLNSYPEFRLEMDQDKYGRDGYDEETFRIASHLRDHMLLAQQERADMGLGSDKAVFPVTKRRALLERYRESDERLAREYLHEDGPVFRALSEDDDKKGQAASSAVTGAAPSEEETDGYIDLMARMLILQERRIRRLQEELLLRNIPAHVVDRLKIRVRERRERSDRQGKH